MKAKNVICCRLANWLLDGLSLTIIGTYSILLAIWSLAGPRMKVKIVTCYLLDNWLLDGPSLTITGTYSILLVI